MLPKVDTLSPVFLVPGAIVLVGVASLYFALSILCATWVPSDISFGAGTLLVVTLVPVAYVIGYWCWTSVSDHNKHYNAWVVLHMLRYIAFNLPLRNCMCPAFLALGYDKIAETINGLVERGCTDTCNKGDAGPESDGHAKRKSDRSAPSDKTRLRVQLKYVTDKLGKDAEHFGLPMLVWDALYDRNNPNCIGRMLSSWNNYKYAITTRRAIVICLGFVIACSLLIGCNAYRMTYGAVPGGMPEKLSSYVMALGVLLVFLPILYLGYRRVARVRASTFARDLVYGLRSGTFGGLQIPKDAGPGKAS